MAHERKRFPGAVEADTLTANCARFELARGRLFELGGSVLEGGLHFWGEDVGFVNFEIVDAMAGGVGLRHFDSLWHVHR